MSMLKKLLLIVSLVVTLAFVIFFIQRNGTEISIDFFVWVSPSLSVGACLLLALVLGALVTYLISVFINLKLKTANARLQRKVSRLESELQRSKDEPVERA